MNILMVFKMKAKRELRDYVDNLRRNSIKARSVNLEIKNNYGLQEKNRKEQTDIYNRFCFFKQFLDAAEKVDKKEKEEKTK